METRQISFDSSNLKGVYFAIQDEGACVLIKRVRVYYTTCDSAVGNFAYFHETPTASSNIVERKGECVEHANQKTDLTRLCQSNGNWFGDINGECVCKPGYQGDAATNMCTGESIGKQTVNCLHCRS